MHSATRGCEIQMNSTIYLNGEFVPTGDGRISVHNGGWLHGAGLFETMRAENGRVFRFEKHLDRLCKSAETLIIPVDRTLLPDGDTLRSLLDQNGLSDARVRLTVSAGNMLVSSESDESPLTVCVTAAPLAPYSPQAYDKGFTVLISRFRQSPADPLAGHKCTSFLPRLIALREAREANCDEALWFTPGNLLAEGSISNVFVVKDDVVITPHLDTPVLPGIARSLVLEICRDRQIETQERPVNINDVLDADEVFLTNTIMQIMPVCAVEKREIANGAKGKLTVELLTQYRLRVASECGTDHGPS
jgi:branched-chain amino acid aminotransferase